MTKQQLSNDLFILQLVYARSAQFHLVRQVLRKRECWSFRARKKNCDFGGLCVLDFIFYVFDHFTQWRTTFHTSQCSTLLGFVQQSQLLSAPPCAPACSSVNSSCVCSSLERQIKHGLSRVSGVLRLIFAKVKTAHLEPTACFAVASD